MFLLLAAAAIATNHISYVSGHASIFHPAMWGFNVTDQTFPYDNRAVAPLMDMTFDQWWFHGHLDYPPHAEDVFELPAGSNVTTEIGCNKGATSYFASSEGGDIRSGDDVCPGSDISEYHTTGIDDVKGCALAIAYKSNVSDVQPEDFTVFSVNQTCVWTRFTDFSVPQRMPPCPDGGCICAWFWIHSPDSGGEQNYMTGFQCNVTNSVSTTPLAPAQLARRCGADPTANKADPVIGNCTYGAKMPHYWYQKERNTMFEDTYHPPFYTDLYNFLDGPQDDIFADSYHNDSIPQPSENQTALPVLKTVVQGQKFRVPDAAQVLSNNSLLALIQQAEASASTFIASATVGAASVQASSTEAVQSATSGAPASSSALSSVSTSAATAISTSVTTSIETTTETETQTQTQTVVVIVAATSTTAPAGTTMFLNSINPSLSATADASASTASGNGSGNGTAFASMNGELNSMVNAVNMTSAADTSNVELVSACKRSDPSEPQSSTTSSTDEHYSFPRTWASRLGMGTYERKRSMHSRTGGVEALWGLGLW